MPRSLLARALGPYTRTPDSRERVAENSYYEAAAYSGFVSSWSPQGGGSVANTFAA